MSRNFVLRMYHRWHKTRLHVLPGGTRASVFFNPIYSSTFAGFTTVQGSPAAKQVLLLSSNLCIPCPLSVALGLTIRRENTQELRQALPAFVEDGELQEVLARCEISIRAGEAAGIEQALGTAM